ncbi:hypothetical protein R1flu_006624 [Riccia fluitans]|uniref:Uncharacterized protein n=1 Tax=Riccia fluitans TaxID=41844 RepID=A0ABD1YWW1_9MARC
MTIVMNVMMVEFNEDEVINKHEVEVEDMDMEDMIVDVVFNLNEIIINVLMTKMPLLAMSVARKVTLRRIAVHQSISGSYTRTLFRQTTQGHKWNLIWQMLLVKGVLADDHLKRWRIYLNQRLATHSWEVHSFMKSK